MALSTLAAKVISMDKLSALNAFMHAAQTRSFTRAGQRIGLSASAIAKAIGRLEASMSTRLFHRSTRSIVLTQEGQVLLESCQRIMDEIEAIEERFADSGKVPRGKLRVSIQVPGSFLAPMLQQFMSEFPEIELDLDFRGDGTGGVEEGFDVSIRSGAGRDSRLMSRHLGYSRRCVVGAPGYFTRQGIPQTPSDLSTHICLHHRNVATGKLESWPLKDGDPEVNVIPVSAAANTLGALIQLAQGGAGLACLPALAIQRPLRDGSLISVLGDYVDHADQYVALWPSSRHLAPRIRAFVDFIAQKMFSESACD
jgi:DNA-binding transcriptional LysR family regulator